MSQIKDGDRHTPTTFASLPREIRDLVYGFIVVEEKGSVAATRRPTDYGDCKGFEAMRAILHASSTSNTLFAREAYEIFFNQNTFRVNYQDLPEFVNRKSHYLKTEGYFDVNAWIGCLEVTVSESICDQTARGKRVDDLRQLLVCPRLHTVSIQIECSRLRSEEGLQEIIRAIAKICAQLREKMGDRFTVETDGNEIWGNKMRQPLSPWILSGAASSK